MFELYYLFESGIASSVVVEVIDVGIVFLEKEVVHYKITPRTRECLCRYVVFVLMLLGSLEKLLRGVLDIVLDLHKRIIFDC